MQNIRKLTGHALQHPEIKKLKDSFLGKSRWAFILPAGDKSGCCGLTANCFNLRFGAFALRLTIKSKEELQSRIFRLKEMMKNPDFDDNWRNDTNQQREADSLSQIGWQLCGFDIRTGETEIKKWRSMTDVKLLPAVLPFLDKVWIYVGKGEDITRGRIYIRDKLNA